MCRVLFNFKISSLKHSPKKKKVAETIINVFHGHIYIDICEISSKKLETLETLDGETERAREREGCKAQWQNSVRKVLKVMSGKGWKGRVREAKSISVDGKAKDESHDRGLYKLRVKDEYDTAFIIWSIIKYALL